MWSDSPGGNGCFTGIPRQAYTGYAEIYLGFRQPPGMDPGVRTHGNKANPIGYLWSKYEWFLTITA